jgi:hypothetical protein
MRAAARGTMSAFVPPGDCPNCGESVPAGVSACPHCGADERTGWSEETYLDGVDLPGEETESDRRHSHGREDGLPRDGRSWLSIALVAMLALVLSGAWWLLVR